MQLVCSRPCAVFFSFQFDSASYLPTYLVCMCGLPDFLVIIVSTVSDSLPLIMLFSTICTVHKPSIVYRLTCVVLLGGGGGCAC